MNGVIFDFNGTLYWDSKLHYDAWRDFSKILRGTAFTDEEMREKMFGHTNEDIIEYAIGKKPTPEMVEKYAKEKEAPDGYLLNKDKHSFEISDSNKNVVITIKNVPDNPDTGSIFIYTTMIVGAICLGVSIYQYKRLKNVEFM